VREAGLEADRSERLRLYYVAMTRAIDRLIVSGAIDVDARRDTPIGWVLSRLDGDAELAGGGSPVELVRDRATFLVRVDRRRVEAAAEPEEPAFEAERQLTLFAELPTAPPTRGYVLPELAPVPVPPVHRVRRLSYSALALFERCSYRYYAERVAGLRERRAVVTGSEGLAATEIGDAVHRLLELVDLTEPRPPDPGVVRTWYPAVGDEELERIGALVEAYCQSALARRIAALPGARAERPFAFEHDGVLIHGRFDVLHREGAHALVADYKTNLLGDRSPEEIVEADYRGQRLVYALACFRAGADEVEVVYAFLEHPDAVVSTVFSRADVPALEAELSGAIRRIDAGEFVPSPGEFTCLGCPALELVCAGPRLGAGAATWQEAVPST
jgi:ATP-dependent exoDNAse (exonuclease V) beta subunit